MTGGPLEMCYYILMNTYRAFYWIPESLHPSDLYWRALLQTSQYCLPGTSSNSHQKQ